jgi:hypothetical protein
MPSPIVIGLVSSRLRLAEPPTIRPHDVPARPARFTSWCIECKAGNGSNPQESFRILLSFRCLCDPVTVIASSQQQQPQATVPSQQQASATRKKPVPPIDAGTAPSGASAGSGPMRMMSPRVQELQQQAQQFPRHPMTPENAPGSRNQSDTESTHGFERPANPGGK